MLPRIFAYTIGHNLPITAKCGDMARGTQEISWDKTVEIMLLWQLDGELHRDLPDLAGVTEYRVKEVKKWWRGLKYSDWARLPIELQLRHPEAVRFETLLRASSNRLLSPLQQEALNACQRGDHIWMFHPRFEGHAR